MDARGWSLDDLLNRMPGNRALNEVWVELIFAQPDLDFETRRDMSLGDASALAHAFGTSKELWTNLDEAYHHYLTTQPKDANE